jgi:hypothetical protein
VPARWREELDVGRQRVRSALEGRPPLPRPRPAAREEPSFNASLHESAATAGGHASGDNAAITAENERLRAFIGELRVIAEASLARTAELETLLTETHWRAERMAEVLELPGVRRVLVRITHPDAKPDASEEERQARTEATSKINAAYDLIDRAKEEKP